MQSVAAALEAKLLDLPEDEREVYCKEVRCAVPCCAMLRCAVLCCAVSDVVIRTSMRTSGRCTAKSCKLPFAFPAHAAFR